jgi:choline dehydrogenase-like flavoprotein
MPFIHAKDWKDGAPAVDVCIIGSGAGGSVAAAELAKAGFSVVVLEEGGHYTHKDFKMREDQAFPQLYQESGSRATKDVGIAILQGRAVGGSTVVNWTTSFRTPEKVIAHWKEKHDVGGFTFAELGPHWDAVEERLGIAQIAYEETNPNNRTLYDGFKALGLQVDTTRRNVRNCLKSGYCGMGCPVDAKQSMLITYLPDAVDKGATVVSRCKVDKLRVEAGQVTAAECSQISDDGYNPSGRTFTVRANRFIVAAGAINSPAILIRSGLGGGFVGRRTFLHPVISVASQWAQPINPFYGAPQSVASHAMADRGADKVGIFFEAAPLHPMLAALGQPGFGEEHAKLMTKLPMTSAHIALTIDGFLPTETGGTVEVRKSGAPVLAYDLPPQIFEAMREAMKTLVKADLAAKAQVCYSGHDPPLVFRSEKDLAQIDSAAFASGKLQIFSAHVMGGCKMGDKAESSVVRSTDLRHHTIGNLHVVDGSVFPTSLGVNPQESIYGLSHLMSSRFIKEWKRA